MSSCHLIHRSFCTQGLPGVAESTFQKAKENLLPCEKLLGMADEGGFDHSLPSPTVFDGPPLPEGEDSFRAVDSATSPLASRRMTGVGGIVWGWKVF